MWRRRDPLPDLVVAWRGMATMPSQRGVQTVAGLSMLRKAVKAAVPGTGAVLEAIRSANFSITAREFTRLIRSCRNTGQWEKALEILQVVRQEDLDVGARPNFFTFSATISVCSKSRRLEETLWLFNEMKAEAETDASCKPDGVVYRLVIMCCHQENKFDRIVELYIEMSKGGIETDDQTLQHVLSSCMEERAWGVAIDVLDDLHSRNITLSTEQYASLMALCVAEGDMNSAIEVFIMMQMMEVMPDTSCCHSAMSSIKWLGDPCVGIQLLKDMKSCDITVLPETYACILKQCMDVQSPETLSKVIEVMGGSGN